jgi:hypothetical protein
MDAAAGWAGGTLEVWSKGKAPALGMAVAEREPEDDLCSSMHAWYRVGFPDERDTERESGEAMAVKSSSRAAVLYCRGSEVRLGIGPTLATARALIGTDKPNT